MKNRKSIIAIFVLLAVVFLGIGFAATTEKMNVEGTLNTTAGDFDVVFEGSAVDNNEGKTTSGVAAEITENNNDLKIKVTGLKYVGDKITIHVVVKNTSKEFKAQLSNWVVTKPANNKYFKITVPEAAPTDAIACEGTYEFDLVVELLYASIDGSAAGTFSISFDANAVELQPTA